MRVIGDLSVHVYDDNGQLHSFEPGDTVPDGLAGKLGEHCFAAGPAPQAPAPAAEPTPEPKAPQPEPAPEAPEPADDSELSPPPHSGGFAGREAWADYARANGLDVAEDLKRGQIIELCRQAGVDV